VRAGIDRIFPRPTSHCDTVIEQVAFRQMASARPARTLRRRSAPLRVLARVGQLFVLVLMLLQGTAAWALVPHETDPCCDKESPGTAGTPRTPSPDEDEKNCPCPLDCSKGCMGAKTTAIAPPVPELLLLLSGFEVLSRSSASPPGAIEPTEILHVPKR
jgi:hypothetical protein